MFDPLDPVPAAARQPVVGGPEGTSVTEGRRRRGRPPRMTAPELLDRIRQLAGRAESLFRIHRTHPSLYAVARRRFGSWSEAVRAAGLDYAGAVNLARSRALRKRRRSARRRAAHG